jgi:phage recombination protein Bet
MTQEVALKTQQQEIVKLDMEETAIAETLGIDLTLFRSLRYSLFPDPSIPLWAFGLYLAACKVKGYDPMKKFYHIVMMSRNTEKDKKKEPQWEKYPVIMPGIGSYRKDGVDTGTFMGMSLPEFGQIVTKKFTDSYNNSVTIEFPEWCKMTLKKLAPNGDVIEIPAILYWEECYATKSASSPIPNDMWVKRKRAQLEKCVEALCWRKGYPEECGAIPTFDEMEGRQTMDDTVIEKDITPVQKALEAGIGLSQQDKVDPDELLKYLDKIKNADALDLLQLAYKDAKQFTKGDKEASDEVSKLTRERKLQLEENKRKPVPPVTQTNAEWLADHAAAKEGEVI